MLEKKEKYENMGKDNFNKTQKNRVLWVVGKKKAFFFFAKMAFLEKLQTTKCFRKAEKRHFRWHYLFLENITVLVTMQNHQTLQK